MISNLKQVHENPRHCLILMTYLIIESDPLSQGHEHYTRMFFTPFFLSDSTVTLFEFKINARDFRQVNKVTVSGAVEFIELIQNSPCSLLIGPQ